MISKETLAREKTIIDQNQSCPIATLNKLKSNLFKINDDVLIKNLNQYFYDPAVMEAATCIINSITYSNDNDLIKEFLSNMRQIGTESVEGYALRAGLGTTDHGLIVKVARNEQADNLQHEYFVGAMCLNKLRLNSVSLNFAYILDLFKCSLPVIDNDKNIVSYCNLKDAKNNYVVYEDINPAISFKEYMEKPEVEFTEWLNIFMQVLLGLSEAQKYFDFTHYDLHYENVLIRDLPAKQKMYLQYPGQAEFILADKIATIIDYGRSHVKYQHQNYGFSNFEKYGVYADKSFPMYDVFKLLVFSIFTYVHKVNGDKTSPSYATLEKLVQIYNYFSNYKSVDQLFAELNDVAMTSSLLDLNYMPISYLEFINYLKSLFQMDFIYKNVTDTNNILNCKSNPTICKNHNVNLFKADVVPTNVADVKRYVEANGSITNSQYNELKTKGFNEYNILVREINKMDSFIDHNIKLDNITNYYDRTTYETFKTYMDELFSIINTYQQLSSLLNALIFTAEYMKDNETLDKLYLARSNYRTYYSNFLKPKMLTALDNIKHYDLLSRNYDRNLNVEEQIMNWYTVTLHAYQNVIEKLLVQN